MSCGGYDLLSSRAVQTPELRSFLCEVFAIPEADVFVAAADRVDEELSTVPPDLVFAAFCTYEPVEGHFATTLTLGVDTDRARPLGHHEFATLFAKHFAAMVLYGDTEPPGLWTVVLPDGTDLLAAMDEHDDRFTLTSATRAVPGLPEVSVVPGTAGASPQACR